VVKDFTQREGIDYNETFSLISCKDSFRIIMVLVMHYDLELHQIDVKTVFLNDDLYECIHGTTQRFCRGRRRKYGMSSKEIHLWIKENRQWYLKFDETIKKFGFKENEKDNCIYAKFKNRKFIFLILYVDDILLVSSDVNLLLEKKKFLSSNFDMKDLSEASFVLGIIHRDRRNGVLGLSQKSYLEKVLKKSNMHQCKLSPVPIVKDDRFGNF
jgi:hypothetical protein